MTRRLLLIRALVVTSALLGLNYITWRWFFSVNLDAWYIAIPLLLAETYSLIDSLLFGFGIWRLRERPAPAPPEKGLSVDVFITTYNEPLDLVLRTALAAKNIRYPHRTWVLDDGDRSELRALCEEHGIGWITRGSDWANMPRHAKAGNLNNALTRTDGDFILILDADQLPEPEILDEVLGYFRDERLGLVQTPQYFTNVPPEDPLGSQAPLFYGPIQQSKDGWNAAFFCGSNAVIRREALIQIGVSRYVEEIALKVYSRLYYARGVLRRARRSLAPGDLVSREGLEAVDALVVTARQELDSGEALFDVTYRFQRGVAEVRARMVDLDFAAVRADLAEIAEMSVLTGEEALSLDESEEALRMLASRELSPLAAIETVARLVEAIDVDRSDEAQAVMPMSTISVTEDMATCMRMHGLGWRTAYHDDALAFGLAPEDLPTMLTQRLRWAQGTMQVLFRENPLVQKRLTWPQRLMYFSTMWSYLSGFAALVYLAAPVLYLTFGILPVKALSEDFFVRLVPFLVFNQLVFMVVSDGRPTWRGQQFSLALFPTWIKAFTTAFGNVYLGRSLGFAVTPKEKGEDQGPQWGLIRPQLVAIAALLLACVVGAVRVALGEAELLPTLFNYLWVGLDVALLWSVVTAARYRGFDGSREPDYPGRRPTALATVERQLAAASTEGDR